MLMHVSGKLVSLKELAISYSSYLLCQLFTEELKIILILEKLLNLVLLIDLAHVEPTLFKGFSLIYHLLVCKLAEV